MAGACAESKKINQKHGSQSNKMIRRALIVGCLLIAGAFYLHSASKSEPKPTRQALSGLPGRIGNWQENRSSELDSRTLKVLGVNDYISRQYSDSTNTAVDLYIGYYYSQRQGESIHSPLNCLPGSGWNPVEKDFLTIPIQQNAGLQNGNIKINHIVIQKGLDRQVVIYWYQSHGRVIASEYLGKIYSVVDAIRTNRTDAALVRVICPVNGSQEEAKTIAEQKAIDFAKGLFPLLDQYIPN
jgi:EpsI family protein